MRLKSERADKGVKRKRTMTDKRSSRMSMCYLAKGSLSQNFEQFKLRGVSLLRALLDNMGDVDLLDVSIFLKSAKQGETVK